MTPLTQRLLIAAATAGVLATTASAWAFGGGRGHCDSAPDAPRAERLQERHAQRLAEHAARLKDALKLTPAQAGAWQAFSAAMQTPKTAKQGLNRAEWATLTTPQRMEKMQALRAERDARLNERLEAVKTFYATLSPEQQQTFDAQHQRLGRHGGPGRERPGHPHPPRHG